VPALQAKATKELRRQDLFSAKHVLPELAAHSPSPARGLGSRAPGTATTIGIAPAAQTSAAGQRGSGAATHGLARQIPCYIVVLVLLGVIYG
jgi:hypothetical protein